MVGKTAKNKKKPAVLGSIGDNILDVLGKTDDEGVFKNKAVVKQKDRGVKG